MTGSDSYPALLQSNRSTLHTLAPAFIFTNEKKKTIQTRMAAISTCKPTATHHFLYIHTIVLAVKAGLNLHAGNPQSPFC